jgi:ribose 5-phosphate isomerase B
MRVAVAFDHRGVKIRDRVLDLLAQLGHQVVDLGVDAPEPRVDYPDKAKDVGEAIRSGDAERGLLVCGSGVGASVAANKMPGIRAGLCHDTYSAHQGVEHDDMNVLCLGSDVIGAELAAELVRAFLGTEFQGGERYMRRLNKIADLEKERAHGGTKGSPVAQMEGALKHG